MSFIYGRHPVMEAINAGSTIDKVLIQQDIRGEFEKELRKLCKDLEIPLQTVPKERISKIFNGNHQGVLAWVSEVTYYKLADVLAQVFERGDNPLIIVLDGITDVRNLGAIARTAEGVGAHAIVVSMKNAAPVNAEAMKASAGALTHLPVCREKSITTVVEQLQLSGISVFAADLDVKEGLRQQDFSGPAAILLGSEDEGIHPSILRQVNHRFRVPILGKIESYNVSVTAGMILYEVMEQRLALSV